VQRDSIVINVQIIAPAVPTYRVPLYRGLVSYPGLNVSITSSNTDISGLPSAAESSAFCDLAHPWRSFLGGRLFWQTGLSISKDLSAGDVLVVTGNPRFLSNYPLVFEAKSKGIGIVWWGHGWTAGANPATAAIRRRIMRRMDVLLLYTDYEVEDYAHRGFSRSRLFATNNGIDMGPIDSAIGAWNTDRIANFKRKHNLQSRRVLLFCGRLTHKAHLDVALRALKRLIASDDSYLLVVIGDGDRRELLQDMAKSLGIDNYALFLGAQYEESELAPWFLSADCFVYPGSIGLSGIHALGYGLPVVTHSNRQNHMPEFSALVPSQNAALFEESDHSELARVIMDLCAQPERRATMSVNARETVERSYTLAHSISRFVEAIHRASHIGTSRNQASTT
jgi:glycosyltransferase involved in cell wall biosynthesis